MVAERFAVKVGKAMEASRLWYCRSLKEELRSREAGVTAAAARPGPREMEECALAVISRFLV
jgi:hypothetical protein